MERVAAPGARAADVAVAAAFAMNLAEKVGTRLQRAILFGSRARGDALPGSDWDVLVLVDASDRAMREAISEAAWAHDPDFIDVQIFTPERWRWSLDVGAPLLRHALDEGVPVWPTTTRVASGSPPPI